MSEEKITGNVNSNALFSNRSENSEANGLIPDLALSSLSLTSGTVIPGDGGTLTLDVEVSNTGSHDIAGIEVIAVLSTDGTWSEDDIQLDTLSLDIAGGSTTSVSGYQVTVPEGLAPGDYQLILIVNPTGDFLEEDFSNNIQVASQAVTIQVPDLALSGLLLTSDAEIPSDGGTLTLDVEVSNTGSHDITGIKVIAVLSTDGTWSEDDIQLDTLSLDIAGDSTTSVSGYQVTVPEGLAPGDYQLILIVNPTGDFFEEDFSNNIQVASQTVTIQQPGIIGTEGADTFVGTDGSDIIDGRGGDDLFIGSFGIDRIEGGAGIDTIDYSGLGAGLWMRVFNYAGEPTMDTFQGEALPIEFGPTALLGLPEIDDPTKSDTQALKGVERVIGTAHDDFVEVLPGVDYPLIFIDAGAGNDTISAGTGTEVLGGEGDDVLSAFLSASIDGGAGNDMLTALDGSSLDGGAGDDFFEIRAALGLHGGSGADVFDLLRDDVLSTGLADSTLDDFEIAIDVIRINKHVDDPFDPLANLTQTADGALLTYSAAGDTLLLIGMDATQLTASDFEVVEFDDPIFM